MFNKKRLSGIINKYSNYGQVPGMLDHAKRSTPEKNKSNSTHHNLSNQNHQNSYMNTVMSTECTVISPVKEERKEKQSQEQDKDQGPVVINNVV